MHIGFICNEYPPGPHGGVGSMTQTLGRGLVARGHRVTVVGQYAPSSAGEESDLGVRVVRLAAGNSFRTAAVTGAISLWREIRELDHEDPFDILDGPELSYGGFTGRVSAARIIRMNGGHHFFSFTLGQRPRLARRAFERRSFAKATHLCAVSKFAAETTRSLLSLPESRRIEVLPNPVDVERFRPQEGVETESGLVVFVGTLCEKKGVRQLVEAWPQVISAFPSARLVLAGRDSTSDLGTSFAGHLRQVAVANGVRDSVELIGPVLNDDVPQLFARAAVCALPSHMETFGIVFAEAMACQRAVVAGLSGPAPEVIEDGVSGLLCDPHDPGAIADAICRLLDDESLRTRVGVAARARARAQYSLEALLPANEAFFARCAGS